MFEVLPIRILISFGLLLLFGRRLSDELSEYKSYPFLALS